MAETEAPEDDPDPHEFTDESPAPENDTDLAMLADLLMDRGVQRVVIRYSGCGDSGSVDEIEYEPEGIALSKAVEAKLMELAEGYCPEGYQNNDGGYGSLTIFPLLGLAEREHYDHYEDTEQMVVRNPGLPEELREQLVQAGLTSISVRFDGSGDSGAVEEVTVEPESAPLSDELRETVEDLVMEMLPGGWEINEGGFGTFTVDVEEGSITVDAWGRIQQDSEVQYTRWRWRT